MSFPKIRIVSLLPSATEIICLLGLRDQLVGVSHECDFPASVVGLPRVTKSRVPFDASSLQIDQLVRAKLQSKKALYDLDIPLLESLAPDLIVTQALCDVCAVAESDVEQAVCSLIKRPQVLNLEPTSLSDVLECIERVGEAAGVMSEADMQINRLCSRIERVSFRTQTMEARRTVVVLEWIDPPFCAGHWSPELVELAGGHEVIGVKSERSRSITWAEIVEADPDVLLIACCGFSVERTLQDLPILKSNPRWQSMRCVKNDQVFLVDGSTYFSRPGPRLVDSLEILAHALHPAIHSLPIGILGATRIGGHS